MPQSFALVVPCDNLLFVRLASALVSHAGYIKHESGMTAAPSTGCYRKEDGLKYLRFELADGYRPWIEEYLGFVEDEGVWDDLRAPITAGRILSVEFNDMDIARAFFSSFVEVYRDQLVDCVLDNEKGVFLKMVDVAKYLMVKENWDWRRNSFPEIPGCPMAVD